MGEIHPLARWHGGIVLSRYRLSTVETRTRFDCHCRGTILQFWVGMQFTIRDFADDNGTETAQRLNSDTIRLSSQRNNSTILSWNAIYDKRFCWWQWYGDCTAAVAEQNLSGNGREVVNRAGIYITCDEKETKASHRLHIPLQVYTKLGTHLRLAARHFGPSRSVEPNPTSSKFSFTGSVLVSNRNIKKQTNKNTWHSSAAYAI